MNSPADRDDGFRSHLGLLSRSLSKIEADLKDLDSRVRDLESAQKVDNEKFTQLKETLKDKTKDLMAKADGLQTTTAELQVNIANLDDKFTHILNDLKTEQATHVAQLKTLGAIAGGALGIIQLIQFFAQSN